MMKKLAVVLFMSFMLVFVASLPASASANSALLNLNPYHNQADSQHIQVQLRPVGDSGITGLVNLNGRKQDSEAHIIVVAFGLTPGGQYISLYYDNHSCELEPYSEEDVIGGSYKANGGGVGTTQGTADDELDEINSVSVRQAEDFKLLACADVHP